MRIKTALLVAAVSLATSCSSAVKTVRSPGYDANAVKRVAVSALSGPDAQTGQSIADSLVPELMEMGFTVVERNQLETVMKEQSLQFTGALDPATIREVGRLAGVDALLVGDYSAHMKTTRTGMVRARRGLMRRRVAVRGPVRIEQNQVFDSISLRLVSTATGEVLLTSVRREEFEADDLDSVIGEMTESMKKALGKR